MLPCLVTANSIEGFMGCMESPFMAFYKLDFTNNMAKSWNCPITLG
jgi:hypothetical protein